MDAINFVRPYRTDGCTVWDALGRIVAQGSRELCELVMADKIGSIGFAGDLFDANS